MRSSSTKRHIDDFSLLATLDWQCNLCFEVVAKNERRLHMCPELQSTEEPSSFQKWDATLGKRQITDTKSKDDNICHCENCNKHFDFDANDYACEINFVDENFYICSLECLELYVEYLYTLRDKRRKQNE